MATITRPLMGQGKVAIAPRDANGISGGWVDVGDCDMFKLTFQQKFDDIVESRTGNRLISAHTPTETTSSVDINLVNIDVNNLTRALNGASSGKQASGTVTAEAFNAYASTSDVESIAYLVHQNVSAVVLTKGATALVEGTDYTIELATGAITWIATSSVMTAGSANVVSAAYSYAAFAGRVEGLTHSAKNYALRFSGVNIVDGSTVVAELFKVTLNLPKDVAMLDAKHMTLSLSGMLLQDEGKTTGSQFFFIQKQV